MARHYLCTAAQKAATGFTDLFVLTHADLTQATDDADQAVTLDALEFGDIVENRALIEIVTAFDAANVSADNAVTVSLGVTGALTQIIGTSAISAGGAGTAAKTAYATAAGGAAYPTPTGGKDLIANFVCVDADGALVDFSAGELAIWCTISRWADRNSIQR
jgi:hypothetical protein